MGAVTSLVFTDHQEDVRACEVALRGAGQQLKNKPKWWLRKRIRRTIRAGHLIERDVKALVEQFRPMVCPVTGESVVTAELEEAIANATARTIGVMRSDGTLVMKSPVELLQGV